MAVFRVVDDHGVQQAFTAHQRDQVGAFLLQIGHAGAEHLAEFFGMNAEITALCSLADQVEALTAQLDSYAMALNETKAERDNLINLLENSWEGWFPAVHDGAGFDRHEFVFKSSERDLRIAIKGTA